MLPHPIFQVVALSQSEPMFIQREDGNKGHGHKSLIRIFGPGT